MESLKANWLKSRYDTDQEDTMPINTIKVRDVTATGNIEVRLQKPTAYFCSSILFLIAIITSGKIVAEPKRIECWLKVSSSEWGYDITYDLTTNNAEVTYFLKEPPTESVYAGKVEEFPSVLHFIWDSSHVVSGMQFGGITTLDVNRKTLVASYSYPSGMMKGTGTCTVKKLVVKPNKI